MHQVTKKAVADEKQHNEKFPHFQSFQIHPQTECAVFVRATFNDLRAAVK
jgi:hypothetical protein